MMPFTWIDALLVLMVAILTALGARRRMVGLVVGVGAVLLLKPLLVVGHRSPYLALAAALVGGLLLSLISQRLTAPSLKQRWTSMLAGGAGGLLLGLMLLVALVTSLPIERNVANQREIYYPPRNVGGGLSTTLQRSPLVTMGRSILLYPLLPPPETPLQRTLYRVARDWVVVGDPWN